MNQSSPAPDPSQGPSTPLSIAYLPVDGLRPDPGNARSHSRKQIRQIAKSIETFGFNVPILIDRAGNVIAGHGRLAAAKQIGWTDVPTIRLDHLSEAQRKAFMIADNRLAEVAVWNDRLLAEQFKALANVELPFDLETIGFDMVEIDLRIEALDGGSKESNVSDAPIPTIEGDAVTRVGDLWLLGRHKVLCGDARDAKAHCLLLGDKRAAMAFADPPYNVPIDGHVSGLGEVRHREFVMASGEMTSADFTAFLTETFERMKASCRPGSLGYVCMDWAHIPKLVGAAQSAALDMFNLCVWTKPNAGMGGLYRSQHELVFLFKLGPGRHRNNVQLGAYGRHRSNVWPYASGPGFGRSGEEGRLSALRPTVKPTQMVADAILDVTRRGDIVLDPFLGSGTTLMACERTGRRCHGLELDPLYCDVIVRRWQAYAGAQARLHETGQSFDAVAADRTQRADETGAAA